MNNTINSGAINETPFPGAESGLSLVELVGTVEVVCSISAVTLRRSARAVTDPSADGTASTVKKSRLGAAIICNATPTASARRKVSVTSTSQAVCTTAATGRLNFRPSAVASGTAIVTPASGYAAVKRSAIAEVVAAIRPISAKSYAYRNAFSVAAALGSASTLRKLASYIEGAATASTVATAKLRNQLGAQTAAGATGSSSTRVSITLRASGQASAIGTAPAYTKEPTGAYTPCEATCFSIVSVKGISFGAATQANAVASATMRFRSVVSASVTATAIAQSTATDYATAMPAPAERTMTVQGFDRRMEVTE